MSLQGLSKCSLGMISVAQLTCLHDFRMTLCLTTVMFGWSSGRWAGVTARRSPLRFANIQSPEAFPPFWVLMNNFSFTNATRYRLSFGTVSKFWIIVEPLPRRPRFDRNSCVQFCRHLLMYLWFRLFGFSAASG